MRQELQSTNDLKRAVERASYSTKSLLKPEASNKILESDYSNEQIEINKEAQTTSFLDTETAQQKDSFVYDGVFKVSKKP